MFDAIHPNPDVARQLQRIYGLHRAFVDFRLEESPFEVVLERLGSPHTKLPNVIHFAGTNGKGSTLAFTRAILEANGKSVNCYTSPHLFIFNERIRLGKQLISDAYLLDLIARIDAASQDTPLTFFEYTSILTFMAMSERPADYTLLETGMGGRLDCTNIVPNKLMTVITGIAYDHTDFLGSEITAIAGEKAGIMRADTPVVIASQTYAEEVLPVLLEKADSLQAPSVVAGKDFSTTLGSQDLVYRDDFSVLTLPKPALLGAHQVNNAATAVAALRYLPEDLRPADAAIQQGVANAVWRGRMDKNLSPALLAAAPTGWELLYDGAHNINGAESVASFIRENAQGRQCALIVAQAADKDLDSFLRCFTGLISDLVFVDLAVARNPQMAAQMLERSTAHDYGFNVNAEHTVQAALKRLKGKLDTEQDALVIIGGSLYLASSVLADDVC